MVFYTAVVAIDSWHLTGGHFPDIREVRTCTSLNEVLNKIENTLKLYKPKLYDETTVTKEYIESKWNDEKGHLRIAFDYPREGIVIIERVVL